MCCTKAYDNENEEVLNSDIFHMGYFTSTQLTPKLENSDLVDFYSVVSVINFAFTEFVEYENRLKTFKTSPKNICEKTL